MTRAIDDATPVAASLLLPCPECRKDNHIRPDQLLEGTELACEHCPARLMLIEDWDEAKGHFTWSLEAADLDDPEVEL